ncbi:DNA polymerase III subunit chi [Candidatus Magnetaquicoccus inordinatus]|uniref:DNA polymerase III subunit chi n=1 Tax=Candidatus Magnetaquicoccus inordinatus TaxID=2496818 RepID=UPI00102C8D2A|nr:DNA polymerase III subunit chi [Candidatus Magnetaquicoccus inordinatus]
MARTHHDAPVVRFYQLANMPLQAALLTILSKAWQRGMRICLLAGDAQQAQYLDEMLWSMPPPQQFLAHGLWSGAEAARQPILISLEAEDLNQATLLIMAAPRIVENPARFDMVIDFVAGSDAQAVRASRERYRHYRQLGCRMEYWLQGEYGEWQRQDTGVKEELK